MSKIISIISCKGGVGNTTSAVNISSYIKMQGKRVLTVDLDYQHNLSKHFGILPGHIKDCPTIYDVFLAAIEDMPEDEMNDLVHADIRKSTTADVIPSTAKLSSLDRVLPTVTCRETLLKNILQYVKDEYDYIFIDCHPGCDLFAVNALTASDSVIIPVEAQPLALEGLDQVEKLINIVQKRLNSNLKIEGILFTKVQTQTNCCKRMQTYAKSRFENRVKVFDETIKYSIDVAVAPEFGISIHELEPKHNVSQAYGKIAMEVMFK